MNSTSKEMIFSLALMAFSLTSIAGYPAAAEVPVATQGGDPSKENFFNSNCAAVIKQLGNRAYVKIISAKHDNTMAL
jgi:hypothetical protein